MPPIPSDAFYDLSQITDVAVSPTGDRIAYITTEYAPDDEEPVNSLWVVPADGTASPHRLTRQAEASQPTWSPDGSRVGFLSTRDTDHDRRVGQADDDDEDDNGDDEPSPQVWAFDLDRGGDATQLTDHEEGVTGFDWSPDGDRLVFAARDPTEEEQEYLDQREEDGPIEIERLQHKLNGKGYLDKVTTYLFVVDLETETVRKLADAHDGGHDFLGGMQPAWGPSDRIAFVADRSEHPDDSYRLDIHTIDPSGEDLQTLTDGSYIARNPRWSPDGSHLAFTGRPPDNYCAPREAYVLEDVMSVPDPAAVSPQSLSGSFDRTIPWARAPEWIDDETLVTLLGDEGWTRLAKLPLAGESVRTLPVQQRAESYAWMDTAGGTVAVTRSHPTEGVTLQAFERDRIDASADDPRLDLVTYNDGFGEEYALPHCQRVEFESPATMEAATQEDHDETVTVEGLVIHPPDFDPDDPDPRGVVLTIHGGPMAYDEPGFSFQDTYFTSRGYLVYRINYRGSTSYGQAFCESIQGNWNTLEVQDLIAGVDELVDRGWADPDRLFPTGFSQGGVNTAYLVTTDNRWTAAAAEHGVYDLRSLFGTGDSHNWYTADYGLPWENPDAYDESSSIPDVDNVETPILVTAGQEDWRCPPSQAEQLYVSVRKQGVDAKLVLYPGEHHDIGDPDRAIHRLEVLDAWFATYDPEREPADE